METSNWISFSITMGLRATEETHGLADVMSAAVEWAKGQNDVLGRDLLDPAAAGIAIYAYPTDYRGAPGVVFGGNVSTLGDAKERAVIILNDLAAHLAERFGPPSVHVTFCGTSWEIARR